MGKSVDSSSFAATALLLLRNIHWDCNHISSDSIYLLYIYIMLLLLTVRLFNISHKWKVKLNISFWIVECNRICSLVVCDIHNTKYNVIYNEELLDAAARRERERAKEETIHFKAYLTFEEPTEIGQIGHDTFDYFDTHSEMKNGPNTPEHDESTIEWYTGESKETNRRGKKTKK